MINTFALIDELNSLAEMSEKIETALQNAPEGSLYYEYSRHGRRAIPYHTLKADGKRVRRSLSNADKDMIYRLQLKTYARHLKRRVDNNIQALQYALKYRPFDTDFINYGGNGFAASREFFFGKEPENLDFEELRERQNPSYPEQLNVDTELGVFRSREEYIVARALTLLGLRFKYETLLATPYRYRYPDFAVLHPKTGEIIYIEYAGNLSNPGYQKSVLSRLKDYMEAGVYPGVNLFYLASSGSGIDQMAIINQLKGIFGLI